MNDSFPGPEIHAKKGDTVFVTVQNDGPYGITIHWYIDIFSQSLEDYFLRKLMIFKLKEKHTR